RRINAGGAHTCGVTTAERTFCWGSNSNGQLGDGTTTNRPKPVEVTGGVTFVLVSAGGAVTCGLTAERRAYCWGSNEGGRLGDGTETQRLTPTPVSGTLSFAQGTP